MRINCFSKVREYFDNLNLTFFAVVPTCYDGIKNQDETDIDCGGSNCSKCPLTKACLVNSDCYINECDRTSYTCEGINNHSLLLGILL